MLTIIRQKLKEQRNSIIIYIVALSGYALMMISLFPSIQKMDIDSIFKQMPEQFTKFFGGADAISYSRIEGYLSTEYLSFFFVLITIFYIGSTAGSAIAGGREKRTIDFNLSQPVSRTSIILAETITALLYSTLITFSVSFLIYLFCQAFDITIKFSGVMAFALLATLFFWAIYGISIFLSSILSTKTSITLLTLGIVLVSYVFSSLTKIVDKLKDFDKFSLFYLYNPQKVLEKGVENWSHLLVLFAIFIIGALLATIIFNKRDI